MTTRTPRCRSGPSIRQARARPVSGSAYVNFGWALTQNPKYIPTDFPSLEVYIDGSPIGPPAYGYYRSDIATFFPGYANSNGAVGYKILDTTA